MRRLKRILLAVFLLLSSVLALNAFASGEGKIKLGYTFEDEVGNLAVHHSSFNRYDGIGISLEDFRYKFNNGYTLNADLKRLTLKNHNVRVSFRKPGLFGLKLGSNQYRRIYNSDRSNFTRRHGAQASIWYFPHKNVKIYAKGNINSESGNRNRQFEPGIMVTALPIDYNSNTYELGVSYNKQGRLLSADYFGGMFGDNNNDSRDRKRSRIRLYTTAPIPRIEWAIISAGFQHFQNKYDLSGFKLESNKLWGGLRLNLQRDFVVNYHFVFDRTNSDSDFVATDNISHALYVTQRVQDYLQFTFGYQKDVNDDFEDEVNSNTYYLSAKLKPFQQLEFSGEYGTRFEQLTDGYRLLGDQDWQRFKFGATFRLIDVGSFSMKIDRRNRKNERLSSENDFDRFSLAGNFKNTIGEIQFGYSFLEGEYLNGDQIFDFDNHTIYGNLSLKEIKRVILSTGIAYSRSRKGVDVESINFDIGLSYKLNNLYQLDAKYYIFNFDDFFFRDQYYTSNIIELNINRNITF